MRTRIQRILSCLLLCALLSCLRPAPAAAAAAPSFRDVPSTHWAADSIQRAVKAGLIQGESATTFGVGRPMSRAAFLVVLCRFFGWEMQTPAQGVVLQCRGDRLLQRRADPAEQHLPPQ